MLGFQPDADAPGWWVRPASSGGRFFDVYGTMRARAEGSVARVRFVLGPQYRNNREALHGGYLLAMVDQAIFTGASALGKRVAGGVTLDLSAQFMGAVLPHGELDVLVEPLRETGRFLFVRGTIEQQADTEGDGSAVLAFSATIRKPS